MSKRTTAVLAIVAALVAAPMAFARITRNTIDTVAVVTENGRHVVVTGPLECTVGERTHLSVTVTQRTTGAIAAGRGFVICTGDEQAWGVDAAVQGREIFEVGPATAVAVARSVARGDTTDAHQWLVPITLIAE